VARMENEVLLIDVYDSLIMHTFVHKNGRKESTNDK